MKRLVCILMVTLMSLMSMVAVAEEVNIIWDGSQYVTESASQHMLVLLPEIRPKKEPRDTAGAVMTLKAGDEVTVISDLGEWVYVEDSEGNQGYTRSGYIGEGYIIHLLGSNRQNIWRWPGAEVDDTASIAADRIDEDLIVFAEMENYFVVVTLDGRWGFLDKSGYYEYK